MNKKMISFILGHVLVIESTLMIFPCIVAVIYREKQGFWFLAVLIVSGIIGRFICKSRPSNSIFYLKEGCIATALSWILMSIVGCLPFYLSGDIPSFTDALFETISGFTTTGASILNDVEALSHCCLFWRSFTHWIGGMGILVFLLAIVSMSGGSHMNLMRAESPGPSVGKLVPKVKHTAKILYSIYSALTVLQIIFLIAGRMPVFDAVATAFGTAGTGGFSIKADSIASYSPYVQWVVTIFMILFGVNFNAYYFILFRKWKQVVKIEEVRWYFIIIIGAIVLIMLNAYEHTLTFMTNLRNTSFQVASIITTTGFATVDFDLWPQTSKFILILLMFIGACAGSTGGGIKVSRIIALTKHIKNELYFYIHPKSVRKIMLEGKFVDDSMSRSISSYFITITIMFVVSIFIISYDNFDFTTNFTAVAATLNNIGPGLNLVGPTRNFGIYSTLSKYVLMFDMLAGRLELYPLILLFHPTIWKEMLPHKKKKICLESQFLKTASK